MSDLQHYDTTTGQMPLGWGDVAHLSRAALVSAHNGNVKRADEAELEYIRRTLDGLYLDPANNTLMEMSPAVPLRLVRGFGKQGVLAVEWRLEDNTIVYSDIDGKEIKA